MRPTGRRVKYFKPVAAGTAPNQRAKTTKTIQRIEEAHPDPDLLIVLGGVALVCFGAAAWALWLLRGGDSKRDHQSASGLGLDLVRLPTSTCDSDVRLASIDWHPHTNRACGFPAHGFPVTGVPRSAPHLQSNAA